MYGIVAAGLRRVTGGVEMGGDVMEGGSVGGREIVGSFFVFVSMEGGRKGKERIGSKSGRVVCKWFSYYGNRRVQQ